MATTTTEIKKTDLPAVITGKFNIALTNANFQKMADEANKLVFNEDNLETIADFLARSRRVDKAVENAHAVGKAPSLKEGRDWDAAKRIFLGEIEAIRQVAQTKYTKLCKEVQERQDKDRKEAERKQNIKNLIETNAVEYAKKIAECETTKQLTDIESKINLEKTRTSVYQEFLPDLIARLSELNAITKSQKAIVKNLEKLAAEKLAAENSGDDEAVLAINEKLEEVQSKQEDNKNLVQETAINQAVNDTTSYAPTFGGFTPKARRTTWKAEIVNKAEAIKKATDLLDIELNSEKIKANINILKDSGALEGLKEKTINGIRYFESQTF